jgi:acetyltransferase-like isoleucine patch superfamily enzyme
MDTMMKFLKAFETPKNKRQLKKHQALLDRYPQYEIGRGTYGDVEIVSWQEGATCKIGAFCSLAQGAKIFLGGEHRVDWVTTFPFSVLWDAGRGIAGHPRSKGDVIIGNDVWIGTEAMILSGVTIGDGAVVGARAVVSKDIEPYAIYAGNPARILRKRFDDSTIRRLLDLQWWLLPDVALEQLLPLMLSPDIQAFLAAAERLKAG